MRLPDFGYDRARSTGPAPTRSKELLTIPSLGSGGNGKLEITESANGPQLVVLQFWTGNPQSLALKSYTLGSGAPHRPLSGQGLTLCLSGDDASAPVSRISSDP